MKITDSLKNMFAVVGVVSFILLACSTAVDSMAPEENNTLDGRYQISANCGALFHVIDTETGFVETYNSSGVSSEFF